MVRFSFLRESKRRWRSCEILALSMASRRLFTRVRIRSFVFSVVVRARSSRTGVIYGSQMTGDSGRSTSSKPAKPKASTAAGHVAPAKMLANSSPRTNSDASPPTDASTYSEAYRHFSARGGDWWYIVPKNPEVLSSRNDSWQFGACKSTFNLRSWQWKRNERIANETLVDVL